MQFQKTIILFFYEDLGVFNKKMIIRHDIDFSLEKALEIAQLEYNMGVKSTYFVLISYPFYNLYSDANSVIIKSILGYGHKIGLHFDETNYSIKNQKDFIKYAMKELRILSNTTCGNVNYISMHRPSKQTLSSNYVLPNKIINTYSSKFFTEIKYLSDSRMKWKTDPIDTISSGDYDKIQLLTHPILYNDQKLDTKTILNNFYQS